MSSNNGNNQQQQQQQGGQGSGPSLPPMQWCPWHQRMVRHDPDSCQWGVQQRAAGNLPGFQRPPRNPARNRGATHGAAQSSTPDGEWSVVTGQIADMVNNAVEAMTSGGRGRGSRARGGGRGGYTNNNRTAPYQATGARGRGRGGGRGRVRGRGRGGSNQAPTQNPAANSSNNNNTTSAPAAGTDQSAPSIMFGQLTFRPHSDGNNNNNTGGNS